VVGEEQSLRKRSIDLSVRVMRAEVGFGGMGETKGVQTDAVSCVADTLGEPRTAVLVRASEGSVLLDAMPGLTGTRGDL